MNVIFLDFIRYSSQEKYSELGDLLYDGAAKFFTLNQNESGIDLSKLYLEILVYCHSLVPNVSPIWTILT